MHTDLSPADDISTRESEFGLKFNKHSNLFLLMIDFFDMKFIFFLGMLVFVILEISQITIVYYFSNYLESVTTQNPIDKRILSAFFGVILLNQYLVTILEIHCLFRVFNRMVTVKNNFILHIIKRIFKVNLASSDQTSKGNVVNLILVDCNHIEGEGIWVFFSIYGFLTLVTAFSIGFIMLGYSFLVYCGVCLIFAVIASLMYSLCVKLERQLLLVKDQRISVLSNIFQNIRYVKFQAMENFFIKVVYEIRKKELGYIRWVYFVFSVVIFFNWLTPAASIVALYWSYFLIYNVMTVQNFMASQQLHNSAQMVFQIVPGIMALVFKFIVMFGRMRKFFDIRENDQSFLVKEPAAENHKYTIEMNNCNFSFQNQDQQVFNKLCEEKSDTRINKEKTESEFQQTKNEPLPDSDFSLKINDLRIETGKLVFIIGRIGSGKSAIIQALLGDMAADENSQVCLRGNISYCPQQSFLMKKSIRENITFYREFNKDKLDNSIKMADLADDLVLFDDGFDKVLNEGGMNVSGGQRARINLARCFYEHSDIYLFDDPFSALDVHVACRIIENSVIRDLTNKTRIIVTHSVQYLKYADSIIYMDQGQVQFSGSFPEFQNTKQFEDLQKTITRQETPVLAKKHPSIKLESFINPPLRTSNLLLKQDPMELIITPPNDYFYKYFTEEDRYEGRQFKLFGYLLKKYFGGLKYIILLILLICASKLVMFYGTLYLLDFVKKYNEKPLPINPSMINYFYLMVLPNLLIFIRLLVEFIVCYSATKMLHEQMVTRSIHADLLNFFDKIETGRLINRFSKDVSAIDDDIAMHYSQFCVSAACLLVDVFIMGKTITVWIWLVVAIFFLILLQYQNDFVQVKKDVTRLEMITKTPIVNLISEIISGRQVIRAFNCENQVLSEMKSKINENNKNIIFKRALESWFNTQILNFSIFFVQLFAFGYFLIIVDSVENKTDLVLCVTYLFGMISTLIRASEHLSELESSFVSVERCDAFNKIEIEKNYLNYEQDNLNLKKSLKANPLKSFIKIKQPNLELQKFSIQEINQFNFNGSVFTQGKIVFNNICAKYPISEKPALKNISFEILPGQKLGIVGKTGSGKTSIIKLLTRYLTQYQGQVLIDDYDISLFDIKQLRSEMLVISQEIALFEGTILENMNPEFIERKLNLDSPNNETQIDKDPLKQNLLIEENPKSESKVLLEAEITQCLINFGFSKDKIAKYGLNLKIKLGGENLSPGEQQLIAIFRALFTNKKIIILDEATASIDYETEKAITQYFYKKIQNKTLISIAHRINTVMGCDKILVLDGGEIVEQGSPAELIEKTESRFSKMYKQMNTNIGL